jgi:hypothetical protein
VANALHSCWHLFPTNYIGAIPVRLHHPPQQTAGIEDNNNNNINEDNINN